MCTEISMCTHCLQCQIAELKCAWTCSRVNFSDRSDHGHWQVPQQKVCCRDAVKAQVVQCCHQFLEMQEEDIQPYLSSFMTTIWGLLVSCSSKSGQDNLALAAISFLTTVCRSTHHNLFASGDTIKQVCTCPQHTRTFSCARSRMCIMIFCVVACTSQNLWSGHVPECC